MVVLTIPVVYCICMLYKWWTDIYEEEEEKEAEEGEEEEINHEDDKDDDCVCHSVNKISNCSHISFLARNTLLIKSDSTDTH